MPQAVVVRCSRLLVVAVLSAWCFGRAVLAATPAAPPPSDVPVAVVVDAAAARAALDKAAASGQGLVADLTLGHEGKLVRAKTATPLTPGRYRLHALVAHAAKDEAEYKQLMGDCVALRLQAGGGDDAPLPGSWPAKSSWGALLPVADESQAAPYPAPWVPEHGQGKLAPLYFDFVVNKPGPTPVAVDWFVRDKTVNHEIRQAKDYELVSRQKVIDKMTRPAAPTAPGQTSDAADLGEALEPPVVKPPSRLALRPLAGDGLPPNRLVLAGLVLERLTPIVTVRIDGRECYTYSTRVGMLAGFDLTRPVKVEVECARPVQSVVVRPTRLGIRPTVASTKVSFPLDAPASLSVEINGDLDQPLFLFAEPPEQDAPTAGTPGVKFFAAGQVHEAGASGKLVVASGETVYIERGAVVRGRMLVEDAKNVKIMGRGILDGGMFDAASARPLEIRRAEGVAVDGVTIVDSKHWALPIMASDRVTVRGVKVVSDNRWDDGVVVVGSRNVTIENCFIRTRDDCLSIKSGVTYFTQTDCQGDVENVTIKNCVLWSGTTGSGLRIATHNWLPDWKRTIHGVAKRADFEPRISNVRGVRFIDNDVIHGTGPEAAFAIHNGDQATVSDVIYENVRVEGSAGPPVDIKIIQSPFSPSPERGHIRDVVFRNVRVDGKDIAPSAVKGFDDKHQVEGVVFENVQAGGQKWAKPEDGPVKTEFATGVAFR